MYCTALQRLLLLLLLLRCRVLGLTRPGLACSGGARHAVEYMPLTQPRQCATAVVSLEHHRQFRARTVAPLSLACCTGAIAKPSRAKTRHGPDQQGEDVRRFIVARRYSGCVRAGRLYKARGGNWSVWAGSVAHTYAASKVRRARPRQDVDYMRVAFRRVIPQSAHPG